MASDGVYYCGNCRRQQEPSEGERCKICGRITVSWDTDRESEDDVQRKWKSING
jgi:rRNA maturation endonuclease Nob1